jgi:hypothetical protein
MKKLIFLKQEYLDTDKINKTAEAAARNKLFQQSVEEFKKQLKGHAYKIKKEVPYEAVLIDYADTIDDEMLEALRAADIVEIIDSLVSE